MRFMDKSCFVTGSSGYIGGEIAKAFAQDGAVVGLCGRDENKLHQLHEQIRNVGGKSEIYRFDIENETELKKAIDGFAEQYGKIDILINCAGGGARSRTAKLKDQESSVIREIINVNLLGTILSCKYAIEHMRRGSVIVNVSSVLGYIGMSRYSEYAVAKAGIHAFTKSIAKELGREGIRCNSVSPGVIPRPEEDSESARKKNYLDRIGTAEDCASAALFLADNETSAYITGADLIVDGGRVLAAKGTNE